MTTMKMTMTGMASASGRGSLTLPVAEDEEDAIRRVPCCIIVHNLIIRVSYCHQRPAK